jgi:hypothetical protein
LLGLDDEREGDGLEEELYFLTDSLPPLPRASREGASGFLTVRSGDETLSVLFLGSGSLLLVSVSLVFVGETALSLAGSERSASLLLHMRLLEFFSAPEDFPVSMRLVPESDDGAALSAALLRRVSPDPVDDPVLPSLP